MSLLDLAVLLHLALARQVGQGRDLEPLELDRYIIPHPHVFCCCCAREGCPVEPHCPLKLYLLDMSINRTVL